MTDASAVSEKSLQDGKRVRIADESTIIDKEAGAARATRPTIIESLPIWVSKNLRSKRSMKLLIRCWLVSWAALILLLPHKSLNTLGNTYVGRFLSPYPHLTSISAFLALLMTLLVPPNMPVQLYLLVRPHDLPRCQRRLIATAAPHDGVFRSFVWLGGLCYRDARRSGRARQGASR